jgi:hypothetical protein
VWCAATWRNVMPCAQMNKQPEIALIELAMAGPGRRGKQGDKKPPARAGSRSNDVVADRAREALPPPPPRSIAAAASLSAGGGEDSDDSQLESSDQESDRRASRGAAEAAGAALRPLGDGRDVMRGGITVDKLHRVRRDASASHSPGRINGSMLPGMAAGGIGALPAMYKTASRTSSLSNRGAGDDNRCRRCCATAAPPPWRAWRCSA